MSGNRRKFQIRSILQPISTSSFENINEKIQAFCSHIYTLNISNRMSLVKSTPFCVPNMANFSQQNIFGMGSLFSVIFPNISHDMFFAEIVQLFTDLLFTLFLRLFPLEKYADLRRAYLVVGINITYTGGYLWLPVHTDFSGHRHVTQQTSSATALIERSLSLIAGTSAEVDPRGASAAYTEFLLYHNPWCGLKGLAVLHPYHRASGLASRTPL